MDFTRILMPLLVVCLLASCQSKKQDKYDLVIANVNLIDGTGSPLQSNVNIFVKDSLVIKIDTAALEPPDYHNIVDGTGKYLIPGLFDCHVHTSSDPAYIAPFIHYGVTSIFITGGSRATNEFFSEMRRLGQQDSIPAPRAFHTSQHFTMEGRHPVKTYNSPNWVDGKTVYFIRDTIQIETLVAKVSEQPILGIKLTIEDGPHPPFVKRMPQKFINKVQKEAEKHDLEVFAHVSDNTELEMAIHANIKNLLHFTGVDFDFERDSALVAKIYRDSIDWVTTLMLDKSFIYPLHPEWLEVANIQQIYDPQAFEAMSDSGYVARANDYVRFVEEYLGVENIQLEDVITYQVRQIKILMENGVNMVLGTDTGNTLILPGYSLHEEMQLMEMGGIPPLEIIKMGTLNAAKMMKTEQRLGSIETGKLADMILLNRNPLKSISNTLTIAMVMKNGRVQQRISK